MEHRENLYAYALRMGDTATVLSHRYCEQVGTAPILEEEIAQANIGLDIIGQATAWLELAAELGGKGRSADDLAYLRGEREYTNYLIAELENGDFAQIVLRGYLTSSFLLALYQLMQASQSPEVVAIAQKAVKEVRYHVQHQGDWLERLGHGTEESRRRLLNALDYLWAYTQEMFDQDDLEKTLTDAGLVPDKQLVYENWLALIKKDFERADLTIPECEYFQSGGTQGVHTEKLGYLLAEMQSVVRAHPGAKW